MRKVIIMSGVSGSGKSTEVSNLLTEYVGSTGLTFELVRLPKPPEDTRATSAYCSADMFFMSEGVYKFDPTKLSDAHGACFRDFIRAVQGGCEFVVVDNTNTTEAEIAPYMLGAQAFGYEAEIVVMTPPNDDHESYIRACAARNSHGVPEGGVRAQFNRILNRNLPPWWKVSYIVSKF